MSMTKKERAKAITVQFMQFIKDNKVSNCCWFVSGMLVAAKLYPTAIVLTILGSVNYALDRVVDNGIKKATEQAFGMFTPEQQDKLRAMVQDMDEMEESVIQ